ADRPTREPPHRSPGWPPGGRPTCCPAAAVPWAVRRRGRGSCSPSDLTPVHTAQAAEVPVGVVQVLVAAGVLDRAGGGGVVAATEPEDAVLPLVGLAQRTGHAGETAAFDGDRDGLV